MERSVGWLSHALNSLIPSGNPKRELEFAEVVQGMTAAYVNARALVEDARSLAKIGSDPRALALTILALEELHKVQTLHDTFLFSLLGNEGVWKSFWDSFYRHGPKQQAAEEYGRFTRAQSEKRGWNYTLKHVLPEDVSLKRLDRVKQASLYVDFDGKSFVGPRANPEAQERVLDEFLAMAEERVDAFSGMHCTENRSAQMLGTRIQHFPIGLTEARISEPDVTEEERARLQSEVDAARSQLEREALDNRLSTSKVEVANDIIQEIQRNNCFIEETHTPDYASLWAWTEAYPKHTDVFSESVDMVYELFESRLLEGERLERSYSRNIRCFKLAIWLKKHLSEGVSSASPNSVREPRATTTDSAVAEQARNELCRCGSGKKYKRCHGSKVRPSNISADDG